MLEPVGEVPPFGSVSDSPAVKRHMPSQLASVGRRLRSNILWAGVGRLLSVSFLFALHVLLARLLPADSYGHYVLIESVTVVVSLLVMAGLPAISLRMLRTHLIHGDVRSAAQVVRKSLRIMVSSSLLTVLGILILAFVVGDQVADGVILKWLPWVVAWAICSALLRIVSEFARGYEQLGFSYLVGGQSGGFGTNGVFLLSLIVLGVTGWLSLRLVMSLQISILVLFVVPALVAILRLTRSIDSVPSQSNEVSVTQRRILRSSLPFLIQQLVVFGLPEFDVIVLGAYSTGEDIALYGSARRLVFLAVVPLLLVNHAIQPFITEFHTRRDTKMLSTLLRGTATLAGIPSLLILVAFSLFPEFVLQTFFGDAYVSAATSLRVLCLGVATFILTGSCGLVLTMTGHERTGMCASLVAGTVYLAAAPWLVGTYGIHGAAIGAATLQVSTNISLMFMVYYHERIWTGATASMKTLIQCYHLVISSRTD